MERKTAKKKGQGIIDLWENIKSSTYVQFQDREKVTKKKFEEIVAKIFPNSVKTMDSWIQEEQ